MRTSFDWEGKGRNKNHSVWTERPLLSRKSKARLSDCGVIHKVCIDHRGWLPGFSPLTVDVNWFRLTPQKLSGCQVKWWWVGDVTLIMMANDRQPMTSYLCLTVTNSSICHCDGDTHDINVSRWPLPMVIGLVEQGLTSHQTHYRSYQGDGFLRVKWPTQQCQSTEGR